MRILYRPCARITFVIIIALAASYLAGIRSPQSLLSFLSSKMSSASKLLPPSLVAEIDQLRQEWGINGASIMIVKQERGDRFDDWREAFVRLGQRDGEGNPMERDVSSVDYYC
jgi:CubicO group peptidase (beta-lactamase class C family)